MNKEKLSQVSSQTCQFICFSARFLAQAMKSMGRLVALFLVAASAPRYAKISHEAKGSDK